jgi:hypothetical protein
MGCPGEVEYGIVVSCEPEFRLFGWREIREPDSQLRTEMDTVLISSVYTNHQNT